jgi:phage recombination protein Bet
MEIVKLDFTPEQVQLIKTQIAPNATDNELKLFLYQCQRTGLNPLTRQIYCIHRAGKMTIQTSIDGFRVIAERSGTYAGQDEPKFEYDDKGKLICAKVTVYRFSPNGERYPAATGVAFWTEYVQEYNGKVSGLWAKMPHTMLCKVAEAIALRRAYPQDLSGLYTGDEMEQSEELPLIPADSFEKAIEMVKSDPSIYDRIIRKYRLTEAQKYILKNQKQAV